MYGVYLLKQARMSAQRPQKTPCCGGTPRTPLRAPLGRWQTTFPRHQGPTPGPILVHPRAQHTLGVQSAPPAQPIRQVVKRGAKICPRFSSESIYTSDVSEVVQKEGKTIRAYNYISGLYAL